MNSTRPLLLEIDERRIQLAMTKADLADRSGIGLVTIRNIFAGPVQRIRKELVVRIAEAVGMELRTSAPPSVHATCSVDEFRRSQAQQKARRIVKLVQGTMALEGATVDHNTLDELEEANIHELLTGPASRLWGE